MAKRKYRNSYSFAGSREEVILRTKGLARIFAELDMDYLSVRVDVRGSKTIPRRQILTGRKLAIISVAVSLTGIALAFLFRMI